MTPSGRALAAGGALALLVLAPGGPAPAGQTLRLLPLEAAAPSAGLPAGWETVTFKTVPRHTVYRMVPEAGGAVLRAESHAAASGLFRSVDLDPRRWQLLSWRWKVENLLARSDPRTRRGDDAPARVYVAFRYDPDDASPWERL